MVKAYTGIDIGASGIKMVVFINGVFKRAAVFPVSKNMISKGGIISHDAMISSLKSARRKGHINEKDAGLALSLCQSYIKKIKIPQMTAEQLSNRLPSEFRDIISENKSKYFYDYYVIGQSQEGEGEKFYEIMASAAAKETVETHETLLRRSGFKLRTLLPQELAYGNIISAYETSNPSQGRKDYCIVDLGHDGTRVHLFEGASFEATQQIDIGGKDVDVAIAGVRDVDEFVARTYKHTNCDGVQLLPECQTVYSNIALEIMQAINFYASNYPQSNLDKIYLCGGGSKIGPLIRQIRENIKIEIDGIVQLMPNAAKNIDDPFFYPIALGVTMQ